MICISNFGILFGVWSSDFSFKGNCGAVNHGTFFIKQVKGQISIVRRLRSKADIWSVTEPYVRNADCRLGLK